MKKDLHIIKKLAELGVDVSPKTLSPSVSQILTQLEQYEKEMGHKLDPQQLVKYLIKPLNS